MRRNFTIEVNKKSNWLYSLIYGQPIYEIEISDGKNDVIVDEFRGFQIETEADISKKILFN